MIPTVDFTRLHPDDLREAICDAGGQADRICARDKIFTIWNRNQGAQ